MTTADDKLAKHLEQLNASGKEGKRIGAQRGKSEADAGSEVTICHPVSHETVSSPTPSSDPLSRSASRAVDPVFHPAFSSPVSRTRRIILKTADHVHFLFPFSVLVSHSKPFSILLSRKDRTSDGLKGRALRLPLASSRGLAIVLGILQDGTVDCTNLIEGDFQHVLDAFQIAERDFELSLGPELIKTVLKALPHKSFPLFAVASAAGLEVIAKPTASHLVGDSMPTEVEHFMQRYAPTYLDRFRKLQMSCEADRFEQTRLKRLFESEYTILNGFNVFTSKCSPPNTCRANKLVEGKFG